jgi:hypothetical protein
MTNRTETLRFARRKLKHYDSQVPSPQYKDLFKFPRNVISKEADKV